VDGVTVRIEHSELRPSTDTVPIVSEPARVKAEFVSRFADPDQLRPLFAAMFEAGHLRDKTGGIHTGALVFDGQVRTVREDVSRHCVIDKLIGAALHEGLRLEDCQVLLTGRVSGSIATKLARAGVPVVATMSVPTTLAGSIAGKAGITIIGRGRGPNPHVYPPGA